MKNLYLKSSSDDINLALSVEEPFGTPLGIVQFVHGMCEHKERYFQLMEYLASFGYICVIHDHRGHGSSVKSSEDLGFMYDGGWKAMVEDVKVVTNWIRSSYPGLKLTLFGHSMGSMVVRSFVKRYDSLVDALVVCGSPSNNPAAFAGKLIAAGLGLLHGSHYRSAFLQKLSFGNYNKPFATEGYPSAWVCSDKDILDDYHSDPLCQYVFTANGFENLMELMMDCYSSRGWKMAQPQMPVHFISGELDPCRGSDKQHQYSVDLMKKVGYKNVDSKIYPGMRHEILNETDKAVVWEDVLKMLV